MVDTRSRSKVARLIAEYDLDGIGETLEERWTRSDDRYGLRPLADYFNRALLRSELATVDEEPLDGEIENLYRLLTTDDVSSGVRTQTRSRLSKRGIDVEQLERDFVSRQAVHTYLTNHREAEPADDDTSSSEQRSSKRETVERLENRLVTVTERSLADLQNTDRITLGEFNVYADVRVHCMDCGTQKPVADVLAEGSCGCDAVDG